MMMGRTQQLLTAVLLSSGCGQPRYSRLRKEDILLSERLMYGLPYCSWQPRTGGSLTFIYVVATRGETRFNLMQMASERETRTQGRFGSMLSCPGRTTFGVKNTQKCEAKICKLAEFTVPMRATDPP